MAVVFVLGPGMWDPDKRTPADPGPLQVRRDIAKNLKTHGHDVILMEDDPDREGEDLIDKFDRLLRHRVTDVVLYSVLEAGSRSRYLTAVARLGLRPLEWETDGDLHEQIRLLATEL